MNELVNDNRRDPAMAGQRDFPITHILKIKNQVQTMTFDDFNNSLTAHTPPAGTNVYLQALWYDAKGDWDRAHTLIQDLTDKTAAYIHAYLHRVEGDNWNANYWYQRAGRQMPSVTLKEEWKTIVQSLL